MSFFGNNDKDKKTNPYSAPFYATLFGIIFVVIAIILCTNPTEKGINWSSLAVYAGLGIFLTGWGIYMFVERSKKEANADSDKKNSNDAEKDGAKVYHEENNDESNDDSNDDNDNYDEQ